MRCGACHWTGKAVSERGRERCVCVDRERGGEGKEGIYAAARLMLWIYSHGSLQSDLCGGSADDPDTR